MLDEAEQFDRLMQLSKQLETRNRLSNHIRSQYFAAMFHATRLIERLPLRRRPIPDNAILNFGCGVNFIEGLNSDILPLHRFVKGTKQPDIYLSGTYAPRDLIRRFEAIVCEHVLEHVLPSSGLTILKTLHRLLKPGGRLQISVPSTIRFVSCEHGSVHVDGIGLNNNTYNYGHMFMYDPDLLKTLMKGAGFGRIEDNTYDTSPFRQALVAQRSADSIYVLGTKE